MMGLEGLQPEVDEKKRIIPLMSHGIKCLSMGMLIEPDSAVVWRGLMVMSAVQQLLRQVFWGDLHTMVVDMPPGTGDVPLSLCQNIPVQGTVIVTTPQAVATADTLRGIHMFRKLKIPINGIIENMTEFICPACGHHTPLFGNRDPNYPNQTGGDRLSEATDLPILARIPIDPTFVECGDSGIPLMVKAPNSEVAQTYLRLTRHLLTSQSSQLPTIGG